MSTLTEHFEHDLDVAALPEAVAENPAALAMHGVQDPLNVLKSPTPAGERFREYVPRTPLIRAPEADLPDELRGYEVFIKYEGAQPSGAYKMRGATTSLLAAVDADPGTHTAVMASTGNHGNSTAIVAKQLGLNVQVMCPEDTSKKKLDAMAANGADAQPRFATLAEAEAEAQAAGEKPGVVYIAPYDSATTAGGQGTIAQEVIAGLIEQYDFDPSQDESVFFVGTGGGGCLAGNAVAIATNCPSMRVVGAQMRGCEGVVAALRGKELDPSSIDTACDGAAVPVPGELPMAVIRDPRLVHDLRLLEKADVGESMGWLSHFHDMPEPAGALGFGGLLQWARENPAPQGGKRHILVAVTTGINVTDAKVSEFRRVYHQAVATRRWAEFRAQSAEYANRDTYGIDELDLQQTSAVGTGLLAASGFRNHHDQK